MLINKLKKLTFTHYYYKEDESILFLKDSNGEVISFSFDKFIEDFKKENNNLNYNFEKIDSKFYNIEIFNYKEPFFWNYEEFEIRIASLYLEKDVYVDILKVYTVDDISCEEIEFFDSVDNPIAKVKDNYLLKETNMYSLIFRNFRKNHKDIN